MRIFTVALAFIVTGCATAPHIRLDAPSRTAPLEERITAYEELRPIESVTKTGVVATRYYAHAFTYVDYLQLNSGERVRDPRALKPVVDATSPTGKAIQRWEERDKAAQ